MHGRANLNLSLAVFTRAIARKESSHVGLARSVEFTACAGGSAILRLVSSSTVNPGVVWPFLRKP